MIILIILLILFVIIIAALFALGAFDNTPNVDHQIRSDKEHVAKGHKNVRSVMDLKFGRFGGHWEDKRGNRV